MSVKTGTDTFEQIAESFDQSIRCEMIYPETFQQCEAEAVWYSIQNCRHKAIPLCEPHKIFMETFMEMLGDMLECIICGAPGGLIFERIKP